MEVTIDYIDAVDNLVRVSSGAATICGLLHDCVNEDALETVAFALSRAVAEVRAAKREPRQP